MIIEAERDRQSSLAQIEEQVTAAALLVYALEHDVPRAVFMGAVRRLAQAFTDAPHEIPRQ